MALHQYQKQMYLKVGVIVALIILPVAGFFAGAQYQKQVGGTQSANTPQERMGGPRMMMGAGAVGTVKSVSDTSIVITDRMQGTEKTFTLTGDTTYKNGKETAERTDIKEGDTVLIQADRTETTKATSVTLNPTFQQPSDASGEGGPVMFTN